MFKSTYLKWSKIKGRICNILTILQLWDHTLPIARGYACGQQQCEMPSAPVIDTSQAINVVNYSECRRTNSNKHKEGPAAWPAGQKPRETFCPQGYVLTYNVLWPPDVWLFRTPQIFNFVLKLVLSYLYARVCITIKWSGKIELSTSTFKFISVCSMNFK